IARVVSPTKQASRTIPPKDSRHHAFPGSTANRQSRPPGNHSWRRATGPASLRNGFPRRRRGRSARLRAAGRSDGNPPSGLPPQPSPQRGAVDRGRKNRIALPMSIHASVAAPTKRHGVALVGNPNTGKTTLFNALSGLNQRVGNYPGVTVEIKKGHTRVGNENFEIIDLPGTYSLAPRSPDEMLAVDLVLGRQPGERQPEVIVSIIDASNLERNLFLTTQVMELGIPVVVALNMTDIALAHGTRIDRSEERRVGKE